MEKIWEVLNKINDTKRNYPKNKSINEIFEQQVKKTPNNIAVSFENEQLTYNELNKKANQLAQLLREKGVVAETIVGIMFERSIEMIISIIGILKAGGAYLPLDPESAQSRIEYMLKDSKCRLLLTQDHLTNHIQTDIEKIVVKDDSLLDQYEITNIDTINNSNNMAYIIYTSGTTGMPKGVIINNYSVIRTVKNTNYIEVNDKDIVLQTSNYCFDASVFDIFSALLNGAKLVIIKKEILLDITELSNVLIKEKISIALITTPLFNVLVDREIECLNNLRKIVIGGEKASVTHSRKAIEYIGKGKLINAYGPTESAVIATYYEINEVSRECKTIPIGKPLSNTKIYVLDEEKNVVPIGEEGELCISGDGLSRGYLNNDKLTKEKFITNKFESRKKLYCTGDLVKLLPSGDIEYIGRIDNQVKIRGHRVELEEIENELLKIDDIKETVVIAKEGNDETQFICAYFVANKNIDIENIKSNLLATLPKYMIPAFFIKIDRIPLTTNGKVDKKLLPEPVNNVDNKMDYEAPESEIEKGMANIWCKSLGVNKVGINDNFSMLGGHSLIAMDIVSKIREEMNISISLKDLFNLGTIKKLCNKVQKNVNKYIYNNEIIGYFDKDKAYDPFPLTGVQLAYLVGRDKSFEIGGISTKATVEFELDVNIERFNLALQKLINRHPILNTIINEDGTQQVLEDINIYKIKVENLSYLNDDEAEKKILAHRRKMENEEFDTTRWPLFNLNAYILNNNKKYFFMNVDALICDDSSFKILIQEFKEYYNNIDCVLPELHYTFREYVMSLAKFKNSNSYKIDEKYWMNKLKDFSGAPTLPLKCNPSTVTNPEFGKFSQFIDSSTWKILKQKARERNITTASLLCSAYAYVLAHWSNEKNFSLNLTVFNRIPFHEDVKNIIGDFTTLMLIDINVGDSLQEFWSFVSKVQDNLLEALEHRNYDGMDFIRNLRKTDSITDNATLPIVFTSVLSENSEDSFDNLIDFNKVKYFTTRTSQVYIDNQVYEINGGLFITWDYVKQLFEPNVIETMFNQYLSILNQIIYSNYTPTISISSEEEKYIENFNDTDEELEIRPLCDLFTNIVNNYPDKVALKHNEKTITYKELDKKSNKVARYLLDKSIKKGDYVGVIGKRTIDTIINLLGILKSGAAYIPIDFNYPEERKKYIKTKSQCKLFLDEEIYNKEIKNFCSDKVDVDICNKDVAYVIFTSGSTGNPKGVEICNGAAANTILDINKKYNVTEKDSIIGISSLCFDLSVYDIFGTLSTGATLVLIDDQRDIINVKKIVEKEKITIWNSVPAIAGMLTDVYEKNERNMNLRLVLLSGDWIPLQLPTKIKNIFNNAEVVSLGGATEASIWSIYYPIKTINSEWNSIPYGRPLANQKFYVLDDNMQLCAIGVKGELYIGGLGVAKGYIKDEDKTKQSFINHSKLGYIYKTGDYGILQKDGYIEFLGRKDSQIKIRGYRVELGEIENCLIENPMVEKAVVSEYINKNGIKNLYAYIVSKEIIDIEKIREFLENKLPKYMIPSKLIKIDDIPLTINGKIDKKKLTELAESVQFDESIVKKIKEPKNEIQILILKIWKTILNTNEISIDESYYELGADSLKIISILTEINRQMNIKMPIGEIFKNQTIEDIAEYVCSEKVIDNKEYMTTNICKIEEREYYPTSPAQKRMYMLSMLGNTGASYHIPVVLLLEGNLNLDKLQDSLNKVLMRYEVLRTGFNIIDNELVQKIYDDVKIPIEYRCAILDEINNSGFQEFTNSECRKITRDFNLSKPPLLRVSLTKIEDEKYLFIANFHHIIADGISQEIFIDDLLGFYNNDNLAEVKIQYKDYVAWYAGYTQSIEAKKEEEYWLNIFKDKPTKLNLPYDYTRPNVKTFKGSNMYFNIDSKLSKKIKELAKQTGTTLYMVMLSAYYVLLYKYTNENDIVIGSVSSGRLHDDLQNIFGMFVNTIALRSNIDGRKSFKEFLLESKDNIISSFEYSNYDFDKLIQKLDYETEYSRNPLFDTMFAVEDIRIFTKNKGDINLSTILFNLDNAKFDIAIAAIDSDDEIILNVEYSAELFKKSTIERMINNYINILDKVSENSNYIIDQIDIISEKEKNKILSMCSGREAEEETNYTIHQLFENQVEKTPDKIAVVCDNEQLTYIELNEKANQLARRIREYNIQPDTIIAVMIDRSIEMVIAILGILKAGGAYLPIDIEYPIERIEYIIEDSNTKMVLMDDKAITKINSIAHNDFVRLNITDKTIFQGCKSNLNSINNSNNLAYLIYTSGSTGNPKGVMIEHKGIGNIMITGKEDLKITDQDKLLQVASISFDISIWETFLALLLGAELHIMKKDFINNYNLMEEYIISNKITYATFTPNYLANISTEIGSTLKAIITGGSATNIELVNKWKEKVTYINGYGPTEVTICATIYVCNNEINKYRSIPIGRPISNTKLYVLNKHLQFQPIGVTGELYVTGSGLARGYLNRNELTKQKFIENPFIQGERIYATGDLVRLLEDGNLEYIGRIDNQVKVRGYRIELGEIESQLIKNEKIKDAVVMTRKDNNNQNYICAYIVSNIEIEKLDLNGINKFLTQRLPEYMMPSYLIPIKKMPLTQNGKIDIEKLPLPQKEVSLENYEEPENEIEEKLVEIWKDILKIERIGIKNNFFILGGHSLNAIILVSTIHKEFDVKLSLQEIFKSPTIKEIAECIKTQKNDSFIIINKTEEKEYYEASSQQKRIFVLNQIEEGTTYNIPLVINIKGKLDIKKCEESFKELTKRHDALRTQFLMVDGKLLQNIENDVELEIVHSILGEETIANKVKDFIKPFSLNLAPLLRVEICKVKEEENLLLIDIHHIISDGISTSILLKEFNDLYEGKQLEPLNLQYVDYSEWRKINTNEESIKKQEEYWLEVFKGEIPILNLITDRKRSKTQSFEGRRINFKIDKQINEDLNKFANENGVTLYMLYLAGYSALLSKYTGQDDIIIGCPISGREHEDLKNVMGMFVNTLAMRNKPKPFKTFIEFLNEVKENCLQAYTNQEYQFEDLVEKLNIKRDISRNPLFDTMLSYSDNKNISMELEDLNVEFISVDYCSSKFDITLTVTDTTEGTNIEAEYSTKLFKEKTVEMILENLVNILKQVIKKPNVRLEEIDLITEDEKNKILYEFNNTVVDYKKNSTVHQLFEDQAKKTPNNIAVVFENDKLTYKELNEKANSLARILRNKRIGKDDIVGILVERSVEMIIGIIAILKSGAAYLPIDPSYPEERIRYILDNSNAKILLTQSMLQEKMNYKLDILDLDNKELYEGINNNLDKVADENSLAYVIYTSGTTGNAKGVMIEHRSLINYCNSIMDKTGITQADSTALISSYAFDLGHTTLFTALMTGITLRIIPEYKYKDPKELIKYLQKDITYIKITPSLFNLIVNDEDLDKLLENTKLRLIMLGGEPIRTNDIQKLKIVDKQNKIQIINHYGPTESTVGCIATIIDTNNLEYFNNIIGKPMNNIKIYILDNNNKILPIGVPGELCISGEGLARGYLNNEKLTVEKFVDNPYEPGKKMYRTGDIAKWLTNGMIQYMGRKDNQVKIRGFRIEIGEIENRILEIDGMKEVIVVDKCKDENKYLCAYYVSDREYSIRELREKLIRFLPEYMIPVYFMKLEFMPLIPSGKINVNLLPEIDGNIYTGAKYESSRDEVEQCLIEIWEEILGVKKIGINDSFFDLGGDSIKAIQVIARAKSRGYYFSVKNLFTNSTIRSLKECIKFTSITIQQGEVKGEVELTPIQIRYFNNNQEFNHYNQSIMIYKKNGFDEEILLKVFNKIIEHHDTLRMIYKKDKNKGIIQYNREIQDKLVELYIEDLRFVENIAEQIHELSTKIQKKTKVFEGELVKLCNFKTNEGDHLLIVIHHLVVDGVSWRILYEDIKRLYEQAVKGENLSLDSKSSSFKEYAAKLKEYANSKKILQEKEYWEKCLKCEIKSIPKKKALVDAKYGESKTITISLNNDETQSLMKMTNKAYNTQINDILLTALTHTMKSFTGENKLKVIMEGHGREDILDDIDISRTVGWFTSKYPVQVELQDEIDIGKNIKEVKEILRKVPNNGIGYGILRYKSNKFTIDNEEKIDILFNYLGEIDNTFDRNDFALSKFSIGQTVSENILRNASIEINSMVSNGELNINTTFDENEYDTATIQKMNETFKEKLLKIAEHCKDKSCVEKTPSDYGDLEITLDQLAKIEEKYKIHKIEKIYPLNNMQKGMLYHFLKDKNSKAYVEQFVITIDGIVRLDILTELINKVMNKHEILRSLFEYEIVEECRQIVLENVDININYKNIENEKDKEIFLKEYLDEDRKKGFDLNSELPTRISLVKVNNNSFKLIWTHHHILLDGWSVGVILEDLFNIYEKMKKGEECLVEKQDGYSEYIKWLEQQDKDECLEYWKKYLDGYEDDVRIPKLKTNAQSKQYLRKEKVIEISENLTTELVKLANRNKVTVNTLLQNMWAVLLCKYNNTDDVVFGSVVSGRENITELLNKMVGLFINTIPIRVKLNSYDKFNETLKLSQSSNIENNKYNYLNLSEVQGVSSLNNKLINHIIIFENYSFNKDIIANLNQEKFKVVDISSTEQTNYDFNLVAIPGAKLVLKMIYNGNIYEEQIINNIELHIKKIMTQIIKNECIKIKDIDIVSEQEKNILINKINDTKTNYPKGKTINQLFEEQVIKTPNNIAVTFENNKLTYRELNEKANQVARLLVDKGVKEESIVGIMVDRSLEMIVNIMGILKAGAGYLPIDPESPEDRIKYMVEDCKVNIMLTQENFLNEFSLNLEMIDLNTSNMNKYSKDNLGRVNNSSDIAYIIYTSGSTGMPKGVIINHYNAVRVVKNTNYIDINDEDIILQLSNYSFDGSIFDIFGALLNGAKLIMLSKNTLLDINKLSKLIREEKVSIMFITTALFNVIVDMRVECLDNVRKILFGGERVSVKHVKKAIDYIGENKLIHVYGPTESTVYATYYPINVVAEDSKTIPIGKPLANTEIYVLDANQDMVAIGVEGELCISGDGLSRGYLNNKELTSNKFIENKYKLGEKLYRTGDLVKLLSDGNIEFISRIDNQVKIRGHRIELGEIENELLKINDIKEAIVIDIKSDDETQYICAYIVSDNKIEIEKIKNNLIRTLPKYMIPAFFIQIDKLPVTKNGKVDKKALPKPSENIDTKVEYEGPRNYIEKKIVEIWSEVTGYKKISINDNFFDIGGNSLKVMHVVNSINKIFNKNITIEIFFGNLTIKSLSQYIVGDDNDFVEDCI